jgi:hypothetical protein
MFSEYKVLFLTYYDDTLKAHELLWVNAYVFVLSEQVKNKTKQFWL